MAVHSNSRTASVIPFPSPVRTPEPVHQAVDDWRQTQNTAIAAVAFRAMNHGDAVATVREMILEGGAASVAKLLEETGLAIRSMRRIVDELVAIDGIIASAADTVLAAEGL